MFVQLSKHFSTQTLISSAIPIIGKQTLLQQQYTEYQHHKVV